MRFDEFADTSKLKKKIPQKTTKNLDGIKVGRDKLNVTVDTTTNGDVTRYLILAPGETAIQHLSPQSRSKSFDGRTFDFYSVPIDCTWAINGVRAADTCRPAFRYLDAPFDPRLIRACGLEFYLGCITEDQSAQENEHGPDPSTVLPETWTDSKGQARTNLRFQGFAESWEVTFDDRNEPLVVLECVDNTSLMRNQEAPRNLTLDPKDTIDHAIANYLSNFVQMAGMSVEYQPPTPVGDRPVLKKIFSSAAMRAGGGPHVSHNGASDEKVKVWDYLTDVCRSIGHSIYVDGTRIIVQRVRSLMANSITRRASDPFHGRVVDGEGFEYRRVIYGKNLLEMKPRRNFTAHQPKNVEVRCYSPERKITLLGRFPTAKDAQYYALPGDTRPDQKWTVFDVYGISDEKTLRAIAQQEYEMAGRGEIVFELKTRALASLGGDNSDPDLLDLHFGDTIEVLTRKSEEETASLTRIEKILQAQATGGEFLKNLGFADDFAGAYGKAYTDAGFLTQFRFKQGQFQWRAAQPGGHEGGVQITLHAVNYIQIRADAALPPGEEPATTAKTSGGA